MQPGVQAVLMRGSRGLPLSGIVTALKAGTPATMVVLGDSTGDGTNAWVYRFAQWLATKVPYATTTYRAWNYSGSESYGTATTLQTGTAGDRYVTLGATADKRMTTPSVAAYNTTDLDVRVFLTAPAYVPASALYLVAHDQDDGNRAWWLGISASGGLKLVWYPTGLYTSLSFADSTAFVTTRVADGGRIGIRCTLDVDNGSGAREVKFYTSANDGATWTQLGTTVTGAVTSLPASVTARLTLGTYDDYPVHGVPANYHSMELLDGINGKVLACADLDRATNGANTFVDVAGRTWTRTAGSTLGGATGLLVLNGSISGGTLAAIDDVTRLPKMAPAIGAQLFMVNLGHNALGGDITTDYQKLINDVLVRYPTAEPFVIVQNPQTTDAPGFATHTEHMNQVRALAQAQHYRYADVYSKFIANPSYEADWMNGPGAHPNAAGYQVEADVVRQRICRR